MADGPLSRRQMLGLLGAGLLTACSPTRRERGSAAQPSSTTTAPTTTTTTAPKFVSSLPPFDTVNPMSGFVAFGDFGGGPAQGQVAAGMLQWVRDGHRVDALVTTGDNVYDFGEPKFFEAYLKAPYRALQNNGGRPMWATLGNHDVVRGHGAKQLEFLDLPPLPYTKSLPGVRFLFLDANRPSDATQKQWLAEQLAAPSAALFTVTVFHQPILSCGLHGRTPAVIEHWYPMLNGAVPLVLTGHDHHYERSLSAEGTTYIVTGGGGRELYPMIPGCHPPEQRVGQSKHHFTAVEVYSDRMALTAVSTDGTIIDQVDIPAALPSP
jgi:hypothetical protein